MADRDPRRAARGWRIVALLVASVLAGMAFAATAAAASSPAEAAAASAVRESGSATAGLPSTAAQAARAATPPAAPAASAGIDAPAARPTAADPALEARMLAITSELRCLVCQNQTLAESHADLAVDLRNEVLELLRAGRTPAEIRRYMTDRYGDFVLYRPPFKPTTMLLWLGPALLLAVGAAALAMTLRRRGRLADDRFEPDPELDAEPDDDAGRAAIGRPQAHA